jgi:hypothetical protein
LELYHGDYCSPDFFASVEFSRVSEKKHERPPIEEKYNCNKLVISPTSVGKVPLRALSEGNLQDDFEKKKKKEEKKEKHLNAT